MGPPIGIGPIAPIGAIGPIGPIGATTPIGRGPIKGTVGGITIAGGRVAPRTIALVM